MQMMNFFAYTIHISGETAWSHSTIIGHPENSVRKHSISFYVTEWGGEISEAVICYGFHTHLSQGDNYTDQN